MDLRNHIKSGIVLGQTPFRLDYYILGDEATGYGVEIVKTLSTGRHESAAAKHLTGSLSEATALAETLAQGRVTPISLGEIITDLAAVKEPLSRKVILSI